MNKFIPDRTYISIKAFLTDNMVSFKEVCPWNEFERFFVLFSTIRLKGGWKFLCILVHSLMVGSSIVVEEVRHGSKHLQRFLINSSKFLWNIPGWDAIENKLSVWNVDLKIWVWSRISFTDMGVGKLLLVKCSEALNNSNKVIFIAMLL